MIVTSIGPETSARLTSSMKNDLNEPTLLQTQIEKPNSLADKIALSMSILVTVVILVRFLLKHDHDTDTDLPEIKGKFHEELIHLFERVFLKPRGMVPMLSISVLAVVLSFQHGISLVITISLYCWNNNISSSYAHPCNKYACATMGFATVMCIDVSGGVILKPLTWEVAKCFNGDKDVGDDDHENDLKSLKKGISTYLLTPKDLCCTPLDDGLINSWLSKSKCDVKKELIESTFDLVDYTLSRKNKNCTGLLIRNKENDVKFVHWTGPAKTILDVCSHYGEFEGVSKSLENQKDMFEKAIEEMQGSGLTTIAFAYKPTEQVELQGSREEDGLILFAVVGFKPSIKQEVISTLKDFEAAGVEIKLVSSDDICKIQPLVGELFPLTPGLDHVVISEGEEFRNLSLQERKEKLKRLVVMGRCLPEDKLLVVQNLKEESHVVLFVGELATGDNPALREADVGIVEKTASTEMASESSVIILTEGNGFDSLKELLKYGRLIYHNVRMFIQVQLTVCYSGVIIAAITTMSKGDSPITAIQLLWVNFIICVLGGKMMLMELPIVQELMDHKPEANRSKSITTTAMWRRIIIQVSYQVSVLLIIQFKGERIHHMDSLVRDSIIFNTFTFCQVFNLLNTMKLEKKEVVVFVIKSYFLVVLGMMIVLQVLVIEYVTVLLNYARLNLTEWGICLLVASLSWGFGTLLEILITNFHWPAASDGDLHRGFRVARLPAPFLACTGFMFSIILFITCTHHFKQVNAWPLPRG